ncbi:MAG: hypothetical protein ACRC28_05165 [Clostridium sp.]|uniref:hypothetical protein n=1 Tax=Clostridium sp. TaxID=1506 RepID=UPI003F3A21BF
MATKSISKEISFKNEGLAETFLKAIETSKNKKNDKVKFDREITEVKGKNIRTLFGMK